MCNSLYTIELINKNNNKNCYEECPYYSYIDNDDIYHCTDLPPFENCSSTNFFNGLCKDEINNTKNEDILIYNIKTELLNGNLASIITQKIIQLNEDKIITNSNSNKTYQLTSLSNQNNNEYQNLSVIKLNECENILKSHYNLNENDSLIIFKIDIHE